MKSAPEISFVLMTASKRANVAIESRDMMEEIMECGQRTLALHLKIAAWHEDIRRLGQCSRLALGDLKTILVPRQALLKRLDPAGELSVPTHSHAAETTGAPVREACHSG